MVSVHFCAAVPNFFMEIEDGGGSCCPIERGIEVNEKAAAKYPYDGGRGNLNGGWGEVRRPDGTIIKQ